jgi:tryptophanyl-tRNA synthetase
MLYKAQLVPVGQDQVQHLELARRIARTFNHRWGHLFPECEPLLTDVPKLLGLEGEHKMSKSLGNHIPLATVEDGKALWKLLGPAKTDPARVMREDKGHPDVCNLFTMHKALSPPDDVEWARVGCASASIGCVDCKKKLADSMQKHLAPYADKRKELVAHPERVRALLAAGADKARAIAKQTMHEVREKLGLWHSR